VLLVVLVVVLLELGGAKVLLLVAALLLLVAPPGWLPRPTEASLVNWFCSTEWGNWKPKLALAEVLAPADWGPLVGAGLARLVAAEEAACCRVGCWPFGAPAAMEWLWGGGRAWRFSVHLGCIRWRLVAFWWVAGGPEVGVEVSGRQDKREEACG